MVLAALICFRQDKFITEIERVEPTFIDQREELIARLKNVALEVFTDGAINLDRLAELVGLPVDNGPERYELTWPGKRAAIAMLQAPSSATLAPDAKESINFDSAQHVFIEGENLEMLKLLYKSYFGRVKLIYIDPPYNTGNDFIYHDDFANPLAALRFRFATPTDSHGAGGNYALTIKPDHSVWAVRFANDLV